MATGKTVATLGNERLGKDRAWASDEVFNDLIEHFPTTEANHPGK